MSASPDDLQDDQGSKSYTKIPSENIINKQTDTTVSELEEMNINLGTHPEPNDIQEADEIEQIRDYYDNLYLDTQEALDQLNKLNKEAKEWRKKSWMWRIISFLIGILIGVNFQLPLL